MSDSEKHDNAPGQGRRDWRTDQEWDALRTRLNARGAQSHSVDLPNARPGSWRSYSAIAAAACVLTAVALVARSNNAKTSIEWTTVSTAPGQLDTVRLSDSTIVLLGPSTTMRYALTKESRDVQLEGLANFTVTHNAKRPFRVHARNAIATDVGTEFVMRAYAGDSVVRVSVAAGVVTLGDSVSQPLTLSAGAVGEVTRNGESRHCTANVNVESAWLNNQLLFNNESLRDVATELNRWFNVHVQIADSALANRRITAVYSNATVAGVLDALSATLDLRYKRLGDTIIVRAGKK